MGGFVYGDSVVSSCLVDVPSGIIGGFLSLQKDPLEIPDATTCIVHAVRIMKGATPECRNPQVLTSFRRRLLWRLYSSFRDDTASLDST